MKDDTPRLVKIGDAMSQLLNVTFLPRHRETNANESISGRAHRMGWRRGMDNRVTRQFLRIAAWLSQGVNCILLAGHHDITVSARLYLNRERSRVWYAAYRALNAVFFWQEDHCRDSWLADVAWAKEILEFEE